MEKSVNDDRKYRLITLENKLTAMLISSPEADQAAASMDVNVGHFSDPEELPGLAHFLEHMLFLGTTKYPDENSYSKYLSSHGKCAKIVRRSLSFVPFNSHISF